jgi:hypothetical protein
MPDEELTFAEMEANARRLLFEKLCKTFDGIAKIAMRASSEFSTDAANNMSISERLKDAHAVITLIVDEAMRGLGESTTHGLVLVALAAMNKYGEQDSSPR